MTDQPTGPQDFADIERQYDEALGNLEQAAEDLAQAAEAHERAVAAYDEIKAVYDATPFTEAP